MKIRRIFAAVKLKGTQMIRGLIIPLAAAMLISGCERQMIIHNFLGAAAGTTSSGIETLVMQGETKDCVALPGRDCQRPVSGHRCLPEVPPRLPEDGPSAGSLDEVVAGYDYWRNTTDSCTDSNVRVYRGLVLFDIASIGIPAGGGNYLSNASLDFDISRQSGGGQGNEICASELQFVTSAWTPSKSANLDFYTQRNEFPSGAAEPLPIILPSMLPASKLTIGAVQVTGKGHFKVDLTPYVKVWLNEPERNHGITFVSRDERFYGLGAAPEKMGLCPVCGGSPTTLNESCRTHFSHFFLNVDTYKFQPRPAGS